MEDIDLHHQMLQRWQEIALPINALFTHMQEVMAACMEQIVIWWKNIKARLLYIRRYGTHSQKRAVWKLLHPPRRRKVSHRRMRSAA